MSEDILGNNFVNIPGEKRWALPPLILFPPTMNEQISETIDRAMESVEENDIVFINDVSLIRAKKDLALNTAEEYLKIIDAWYLGKNILEWSSECATTFKRDPLLKNILRTNLWPYPDYSCLVELLEKKCSLDEKIRLSIRGDIKISVGMRLAFNQPPPVECLTQDFLFYLSTKLAQNAYCEWQEKRTIHGLLPIERFSFETEVVH